MGIKRVSNFFFLEKQSKEEHHLIKVCFAWFLNRFEQKFDAISHLSLFE